MTQFITQEVKLHTESNVSSILKNPSLNDACPSTECGTSESSIIYKDTKLDIEENQAVNPDWSLLPDVITTEIMRFLSDIDKINMAKSCRRWYAILSTPILWRKRTLQFHGTTVHAETEAKRAIGYALKYGDKLKYLQIYCDHPSYFTISRVFQKSIRDVLNILTVKNTRLKRFIAHHLYFVHYGQYQDPLTDKLKNTFLRFIRRQKKLEIFDMSNSYLNLLNGLKILEALSCATKEHRRLRVLKIEDFFQAKLSVFRIGKYQSIISTFKVSIYMQYIFEILMIFKEHIYFSRILFRILVLTNYFFHSQFQRTQIHFENFVLYFSFDELLFSITFSKNTDTFQGFYSVF